MRPIGFVILVFIIAVSAFFVWDAWQNSGPRIPDAVEILINPTPTAPRDEDRR